MAERYRATPKATADEALALAEHLIGSFRAQPDTYSNPKIFAGSLAMVFAEYPAEIGREVVHPIRGLPGRLQWPPSLHEVGEALRAHVSQLVNAEHQARRALASMPEEPEREPTPEERERVDKLLHETVAGMKAVCSPPRTPQDGMVVCRHENCNGSGIVGPDSNPRQCPACEGKGRVLGKVPA